MRRTGAGVAVVRGDEVLLIRRRDNGLWDIPGGGIMGASGRNAARVIVKDLTRRRVR